MTDTLSAASFTVIIPTRNRAALILDLLRYLRADLGWQLPIIVVDQSDDGGAALAAGIAAAGLADISHLPNTRRGTGIGRNAGALQATTDWLIFLDDDVWPESDYLRALEAFVAANPWLDGVHASLESRTSWGAYRRDAAAWRAARQVAPRERERYISGIDGVVWFTSSPWTKYSALTIGLASGNLIIRRKVFLGIGGFDEQIGGLGDDRELGVRLWWYGYRVALAPDVIGFHLRETSGGLRQAQSRWSRLLAPEPVPGWIYFYLLWFPGLPYRHMLLSYLARWMRRPWLLPLKALRLGRAVRQAHRIRAAGPRRLADPVPRDLLEKQLG